MAFIVEDGTGLPNANALIGVEFYREYHSDRGRVVPPDPTLADEDIQGFILRATDYIVKRFGTQFKGTRTTLTQALPFPRTGVVIDGVTLPMSIAHLADIVVGGTGYAVGDTVTLTGGTFNTAASFRVEAVSTGVVTEVSVVNPGDYSVVPAAPVAVTGGTGSGLTLGVDFGGPVRLSQAVAEYARQASLFADLAPSPPVPFDRTDANGSNVTGAGPVTSVRKRVGPLEKAVSYAGPRDIPTSPKGSGTVPGWVIPTYPEADLMIGPFLGSSSKGVIRN